MILKHYYIRYHFQNTNRIEGSKKEAQFKPCLQHQITNFILSNHYK
jgi:hypothetical protein